MPGEVDGVKESGERGAGRRRPFARARGARAAGVVPVPRSGWACGAVPRSGRTRA